VQRGVVFTIEAAYVILIVFSALIVLVGSMHTTTVPNYDTVQTMKVAHDMGENRTANPPPGFSTTEADCSHAYASLSYYNIEVCMK